MEGEVERLRQRLEECQGPKKQVGNDSGSSMSGQTFLVERGLMGAYSSQRVLHEVSSHRDENSCSVELRKHGDSYCCAKKREDGLLSVIECNGGFKVDEEKNVFRGCDKKCVQMEVGKILDTMSSKKWENVVTGVLGARHSTTLESKAIKEGVRVIDTGACHLSSLMVNNASDEDAPSYECHRSWWNILNPLIEREDPPEQRRDI